MSVSTFVVSNVGCIRQCQKIDNFDTTESIISKDIAQRTYNNDQLYKSQPQAKILFQVIKIKYEKDDLSGNMYCLNVLRRTDLTQRLNLK